jgi:hypothetical protein
MRAKFTAISIVFLVVFISIFFVRVVCFGAKCLDNRSYSIVCIQDDEYFFPLKGYAFEYAFSYPWWLKTMIFPRRQLYITLIEESKILILEFDEYKNNDELIAVSKCVHNHQLRLK